MDSGSELRVTVTEGDWRMVRCSDTESRLSGWKVGLENGGSPDRIPAGSRRFSWCFFLENCDPGQKSLTGVNI